MSHKGKREHTQAYVQRTLHTLPTREFFQAITLPLDILHDNELREEYLDWVLPGVGDQAGPWEIRGRIGKDVFKVDPSWGPIYTEDGLLNLTVYRMYVVEPVERLSSK